MRRHESYVINRLGDTTVTHFYCSEPYGEHMSRALGATDRRVDDQRLRIPVSGTQLRAEPSLWIKHLDPRVRRDLVVNIALLGAPSTGKTTLATALADRYGTRWMPEHGRQYWLEHQVDRRLTPDQLVELARQHLTIEEEQLRRADRYLFADTNAMTTALFCRYYHGDVPRALRDMADQAAARYDLFLVCDTDIPYEDTWDRSGEVYRTAFQRQVIDDLRARRLPFLMIGGTLEARLQEVASRLDHYRKYMPVAELFAHPGC